MTRRQGRVWTELHARALFELMESTKRQLAPLMASAPVHSPVYEEMAKASAALTTMVEFISKPSAGPHGGRVLHFDESQGKSLPADRRGARP